MVGGEGRGRGDTREREWGGGERRGILGLSGQDKGHNLMQDALDIKLG